MRQYPLGSSISVPLPDIFYVLLLLKFLHKHLFICYRKLIQNVVGSVVFHFQSQNPPRIFLKNNSILLYRKVLPSLRYYYLTVIISKSIRTIQLPKTIKGTLSYVRNNRMLENLKVH